MQPYLEYLLAGIKAAHQRIDRNSEYPQEGLDEHFRDIERFISGDSEHTLQYYCGLNSGDFPPVEQFSENEIKQLCHGFEEMLASWNVNVDWPEKLPWDKRYALTVALLDREFTPLNTGMFVFDFCTGYAPECELGEYCRCLEYWK